VTGFAKTRLIAFTKKKKVLPILECLVALELQIAVPL